MKSVVLKNQSGEDLNVLLTETVTERMKGLFSADVSQVHGLWIKPCNSIHTFGMPKPLDLVYMNKQLKILKIVDAVVPWRASMCIRANSVLELHAGSSKILGLVVGQSLQQ